MLLCDVCHTSVRVGAYSSLFLGGLSLRSPFGCAAGGTCGVSLARGRHRFLHGPRHGLGDVSAGGCLGTTMTVFVVWGR